MQLHVLKTVVGVLFNLCHMLSGFHTIKTLGGGGVRAPQNVYHTSYYITVNLYIKVHPKPGCREILN